MRDECRVMNTRERNYCGTHISVVDDIGELDGVSSGRLLASLVLGDNDGTLEVVLLRDDSQGGRENGGVLKIQQKDQPLRLHQHRRMLRTGFAILNTFVSKTLQKEQKSTHRTLNCSMTFSLQFHSRTLVDSATVMATSGPWVTQGVARATHPTSR